MLLKKLVQISLAVVVFVFFYQLWKPYPENLLTPSFVHRVSDADLSFVADLTYTDKKGERRTDQRIWDTIFSIIDGSNRYLFLDMFLFNEFQGRTTEETRKLAEELTERLVEKKDADPHQIIILITDPVNTVYGGVVSEKLERLRKAGILVIVTNLTDLPDSNRLWGAIWRPFFSWAGNSDTGGLLPHPFQLDGPKVTLRSWAALLNFKANHRKLLVADMPSKKASAKPEEAYVSMVTSSNPHTASSANGNVALVVRGSRMASDILQSEQAIAKLGGDSFPGIAPGAGGRSEEGTIKVKFLSEENILRKTLETLNELGNGDTFDMVMFYLSDRRIIRSLIDASKRGVKIRIILDPNKDAFGWGKNGVPNRPAAKELIKDSNNNISVRWCDTHGEQCHSKLFVGKSATTTFLMLGSANMTRRNIGGFNLEADIVAESAVPFTAWNDAKSYFEKLYTNDDQRTYTVDYEIYRDESVWKTSLYRMMERTGLSSF